MFDFRRQRQGSKVSRASLRSAWDWRNQKNNEVMDRMASMMYSVHINDQDQANLMKFMWENSESVLRRRLIKKYNLYYCYWIDYSLLTAFIAMTSLAVAAAEWESLYPDRAHQTYL